ncbi:MAG: hypothetical protein MI673_05795 [Thiotrichales bacterium]|nr:hypothetical protein [Thiotrichales bacterium]
MNKHWLYREENRGKLWKGSIAILVLTVVLEFVIHLHAYFPVTDFFGFNALYGFLACVGMVIFARLLGVFIKRRDDYYDL